MSSYRYIDRPSVLTEKSAASRPVYAVTAADIENGTIDAAALEWARATGFTADAGSLLLVPGDGKLVAALFGLGSEPDAALSAGKLPKLLPAGDWHVASPLSADRIALGFGLGSYSFGRYRQEKQKQVRLALADETPPRPCPSSSAPCWRRS